KDYERIQIEETLFPLLPASWREELNYFVDDEFENKIVEDRLVRKGISSEEMNGRYNLDVFLPLDGRLIEGCDQLAAYREASLSIEQGIRSAALLKAKEDIFEAYRGRKIAGIDFGGIFGYFR
ncbi:MAG TPA: HD domain-containing protein, partial [Thermodesulfobacteriota bacterium]|nr:HD domain-containing protein [Thermodesulfobacteriota bacterium]